MRPPTLAVTAANRLLRRRGDLASQERGRGSYRRAPPAGFEPAAVGFGTYFPQPKMWLGASGRGIGAPSIVEGDDDGSILGLDVHVDDDQPAPGADQCSTIAPDPR